MSACRPGVERTMFLCSPTWRGPALGRVPALLCSGYRIANGNLASATLQSTGGRSLGRTGGGTELSTFGRGRWSSARVLLHFLPWRYLFSFSSGRTRTIWKNKQSIVSTRSRAKRYLRLSVSARANVHRGRRTWR